MRLARSVRYAALLGSLLVVAAACGSGSSDNDSSSSSSPSTSTPIPAKLSSTRWVLDDSTDLGEPGIAVTAEFSTSQVTGNSGCNTYTGPYVATGRRLTIGPGIAATRALCARGNIAEQAYLDRLPQVKSWDIAGHTLTLFGDQDKALLIYDAFDGADAIAGKWTVSSYYTDTAVQSVLGRTKLTADFADGTVTGNGGCNGFSGPYVVTDTAIKLGPFQSTLRACANPQLQTQEQQYLAALELATTFRVTGKRLELLRSDGGLAVTFDKRAAG